MTKNDEPRAVPMVALVAEDEPLFRMEITDLLGEAGFDVIEAGSAAKALALLEGHPGIALLFTDVRMPGRLDGVGLAREVECRWPDTDIIVCSGVGDLDRGTLPRKAAFFGKPYDPAAVGLAVKRTLLRAGT